MAELSFGPNRSFPAASWRKRCVGSFRLDPSVILRARPAARRLRRSACSRVRTRLQQLCSAAHGPFADGVEAPHMTFATAPPNGRPLLLRRRPSFDDLDSLSPTDQTETDHAGATSLVKNKVRTFCTVRAAALFRACGLALAACSVDGTRWYCLPSATFHQRANAKTIKHRAA